MIEVLYPKAPPPEPKGARLVRPLGSDEPVTPPNRLANQLRYAEKHRARLAKASRDRYWRRNANAARQARASEAHSRSETV